MLSKMDKSQDQTGLAKLLMSDRKKYGEINRGMMAKELADLIGNEIEGEIDEEDEGDAMTAQELAYLLGLRRNTINLKLRDYIINGVVACKEVPRANVTGKIVKVPGYYIVKKEGQNDR